MGQVALGFRSLFVKLSVFFVMASLLAWALGGTLWPRAEIVDYQGTSLGDQTWFWRLSVGGKQRGRASWQLMTRQRNQEPRSADGRSWDDCAGPVSAQGKIWFAGRSGFDDPWRIEAIGGDTVLLLPDRLAVERQLARLRAGLPLQDAQTIVRQRAAVLDPGGALAADDDSGLEAAAAPSVAPPRRAQAPGEAPSDG
jgi:hypothetical protein